MGNYSRKRRENRIFHGGPPRLLCNIFGVFSKGGQKCCIGGPMLVSAENAGRKIEKTRNFGKIMLDFLPAFL